jgi:23S rRNA maturation mini-RNase III
VTITVHEELKRGKSRNKDKQVAILTNSRNTLNTIAHRLIGTRTRTTKKEENICIDKIAEQLIETEKEKMKRPRKGQTRKKNRQI